MATASGGGGRPWLSLPRIERKRGDQREIDRRDIERMGFGGGGGPLVATSGGGGWPWLFLPLRERERRSKREKIERGWGLGWVW